MIDFDEAHEDYTLSEQRIKICDECEDLKISLSIKRCGVCQCVLKVKTLFKSQECPKGKW